MDPDSTNEEARSRMDLRASPGDPRGTGVSRGRLLQEGHFLSLAPEAPRGNFLHGSSLVWSADRHETSHLACRPPGVMGGSRLCGFRAPQTPFASEVKRARGTDARLDQRRSRPFKYSRNSGPMSGRLSAYSTVALRNPILFPVS